VVVGAAVVTEVVVGVIVVGVIVVVTVSTVNSVRTSVETGASEAGTAFSKVEDPQEEASNKTDTTTARRFIPSVCHMAEWHGVRPHVTSGG
jgi:archaellum component FlaG (FlaF/FlaG flagellin family)